MLAIRFSKDASKTFARMPRGIAVRMLGELKKIAADPATYRGDWKPLRGIDAWRLRVGDWRVLCEIRDGELVLLVVKIAPRGDAYK
jgi:mRNA interferase RelE/StbE